MRSDKVSYPNDFIFITTIVLKIDNSIRIIPGNKLFERRVEYSTAVRYYWGKYAFWIFQVFMNICLQSLNVASIIVVAQVLNFIFNFIILNI
jgi:hypothetical protein